MTQFDALGLAGPLLKAIETQGFTEPTQIQSYSIPSLMEGHDLMGIAHTGGGKTASFSLPLLHKLIENPSKPLPNTTKALILAPTRELAQQIGQCIASFSQGTKVNHLVIAGGLPYGPQIQKLKRGVDVLIATPGRLMDHVERGGIVFDETQSFILDEADRMLDMGFINDVMTISKALPKEHQTVLFSATMNPKVRKLSQALLNDPVFVEIEQKTTVAETIDHKVMNVKGAHKRDLLLQTLDDESIERVLVFTRTKRGADKLTDFLLKNNYKADSIHGDKRQRVREKILRNFRNGRVKILVATDLAARGIDVDDVTHVINYELPIEPENYVHRVGRTGRAGRSGIAVSFCDPEDVGTLLAIERMINVPIEVDESHDFHVEITKTGAAASKKKPQRGGYKGRSNNGAKFKGSRNNRFKDNGFKQSRSKRREDGSGWSPVGDQAKSVGKRSANKSKRKETTDVKGVEFKEKRTAANFKAKTPKGDKTAQKGPKKKPNSPKFGQQQKRRVRSKHAA